MPTEPTTDAAWFIDFDGRPVPTTAGESVGAALTNAGIRSWRTTRKAGRPRGLFCGIGICYDCLLTVDGQPNQRACLTPVAPGMRLESGAGSAEASEVTHE
jgi:predicted molibdopterin-dependent oxidoreductase YjgC